MRGYYERDDEAIRQSLEEERKRKEAVKKSKLEDITHFFSSHQIAIGEDKKALARFRPVGLPVVIIYGSNGLEIPERVGLAWLDNSLPNNARFYAVGKSESIGSYRLMYYNANACAVQFYKEIDGGEDE